MTVSPDAHAPPLAPLPQSPRRWRLRLITRAALKRLLVLACLIVVALAYMGISMIHMPGKSHSGPLPLATPAQQTLAADLRKWVNVLADATGGVGRAGNRSTFYPKRFAASAA